MSLSRSHQRSISRGSSTTTKPSNFRHPHQPRRRSGFTLVEILVTTVITLIIIFSVLKVFQIVGENVAVGRAVIEMSGQLRNTTRLLQQDLEGLTVSVRPGAEHSAGRGFVEFVEGPKSDSDRSGNGTNDIFDTGVNNVFGDLDDVLTFTTRSKGRPFVGRVLGTLTVTSGGKLKATEPFFDSAGNANYSTIESQVAEVIWFTAKYDRNESGAVDANEYSALFRIVLPIRPDIDLSDITPLSTPPSTAIATADFFKYNVISSHLSGSDFVANSLADLTIPINRSLHVLNTPANPAPTLVSSYVTAFAKPHPASQGELFFDNTSLAGPLVPGYFTSGIGETSIMSSVAAFDMRLYDTTAHLWSDTAGSEALAPGDPGYADVSTTGINAGNSSLGTGAYVDMNYGAKIVSPKKYTASLFSGPPQRRSGLYGLVASTSIVYPIMTYDTWSMHYELDGVDSDQDGITDEGTDGLDNDGANGVDDPGERETLPPYTVPLRGLSVRIRVIDPDSRQVRQATVVTDFTPE